MNGRWSVAFERLQFGQGVGVEEGLAVVPGAVEGHDHGAVLSGPVFDLAAAGLGVTLSPKYVGVVARDLGLVVKRLEAPEIVRELSLYLPRRALTPTVLAFAEFLERHLKSRQGGRRGTRA